MDGFKTEPKDFHLNGWRVRSELPLPEGLAWNGPDSPVDVTIRLGEVSDSLVDPIKVTPFLQIDGNGDCRLEISAAGRYLVRQGSEVIVQPAPGATLSEVYVFLFGSVLGLLCHQRGLFPLHASCVAINGGAVAFCGASGAGKSTLAATLVKRGHPLISDDVTVINPMAECGPLVFPGLPRMRLWRDSLSALEISHELLLRDRIELEKYTLESINIGEFLTKPIPLRAILILETANAPDLESVSLMTTMGAIAKLTEQVYRRQHVEAFDRIHGLFQGAARIAGSVPVWSLKRYLDLTRLNDMVDRVEELVGL